MKSLLRSALLFSIVLTTTPAFAETVVVTVKGMVCSFCAQGIKKTFSKVDGVKTVEVDLEKKFVKLSIDDQKKLSDETITTLIMDSGYDVHEISRTKDD